MDMMIQEFLSQNLNNVLAVFSNQIPQQYMPGLILAFYTVIIVIYAIFIWKFYKFLARRNILNLNLSQYNRTEHPFWNKFLASIFFLLEYIVVIPIFVFFWFSIFAIFLLLLSKNQDVSQILIISAAMVAAIRITAYYSSDLSKDLAKLFPLTLLVIFLVEPEFFSVQKLIEKFLGIPSLLNNIFIYLIFIALLEIIMRFLFTVTDLIFGCGER